MSERTAGVALGAAIVLAAVLLGAADEGWSRPDRPGETRLLGDAAMLYPSERAAREVCGADPVVYVLDDRLRYVARGSPEYGAAGKQRFPSRGYACAADAATALLEAR